MWLPVVVPYVFEPYSNIYDNRSGRAGTPMNPFDQRVCRAVNETVVSLNFLHAFQGFRNDPPYAEDERKLKVKSSLFNLVRVYHSLELTDPKLLGWYLSLPVDDRTLVQQEGGLLQFIQRHPNLEVARKWVYVKQKFRGNYSPHPTTMSSNHKSWYPTLSDVSQCQNCGYSFQCGTKKCYRCGVHVQISAQEDSILENENDLELLPSNVREELNIITSKNETSQQSYGSFSNGSCNAQAQCLSELWEEVEKREDIKHFHDLTSQANHSLDMELDMQCHAQRVNNFQNDQDRLDEESEAGENFCDADQETKPEYYSFSSTSLNHTEWSDGSQHMESGFNDSIMATKGSTELSDVHSETTMASAVDSFSRLGQSFELANEPGDHVEYLLNKEPPRSFVNQIVDACGDFRACFTSTRATEVCQNLQTKACQSVATDTDSLPVSSKKDTHVATSTSDKSIVTEVYMADLEFLTEEFIKLKETEKELKQLKERKSRPSPGGDLCRNVGGCDCAQRVKRAELRLLGLQYIMCQQHCWRRYFTSPLGESAPQGTDPLPDIIAETLKALEKDYHDMMRQLLAGTPLDDLKPLSVESQKMITTGTNYSPTSVLEAHLGSFDCLESTVANNHALDGKDKRTRAPLCQNTEDIQDEPNVDSSNRVETAVPSNKHHGNYSAIKDLNGSEAWFDAEEELQDGNMEKQEGRENMIQKMEQKGTDLENSHHSSLLCVTCLPRNVTEEMLILFEKYHATGVSISTFSNNIRAAIVDLNSANDAKAAVKDLNGCTLQGHTLCVQQLCGPTSAHPKLNDQPHDTVETIKTEANRQRTKGASARGPRCSVDRLTKVCDSPTASGTCVPQRYADTGSFNTIILRLLERHPDVDRQKIVDAMLKLRDMNQGILRGFTLNAIVDMTSKLITQDISS
ncbi:RNA-binding protein 44 isoform X2 [Triplophysa dalaica]|uniref:RNA-binding protein 44 isoform X2 n=1 Tax=Triplophysa dalaica TaxID=1582913 RepID=UPI0024DFA6A1|nr:RNA-binding protein 44 isoform X2 [Triplophysa dalaica]